MVGGALGNAIDRLHLPGVVDFLDFYIKDYHFPAFNVADSAITIGVGLFILGSLLSTEIVPLPGTLGLLGLGLAGLGMVRRRNEVL